MKAKGVTQDALSELLGMTQGGLQHWLAGTRQPSLDQINRIAAVLDVAPGWLTHGIEPADMLDGIDPVARATLQRFIRAARARIAPPSVWQSLNATADLAGLDPAAPLDTATPLGAPIHPDKVDELQELAQQAEERHASRGVQRKRAQTK